MTNEPLELQIVALTAMDRIDVPVSSMSGKLKRGKSNLAKGLALPDSKKYKGERVYARIDTEETKSARGMKEGIEKYCTQFPKQGEILQGMIDEERTKRETRIFYGLNDGCRLTREDYITVMTGMKYPEVMAGNLYEGLINASRYIAKKRDEERSILLESTL